MCYYKNREVKNMRKRLTRKAKNKRKKQIIILSTTCLLLVLTVGYAAFSTNLNLKAKGNIQITDPSCFTVSDNGDGTGTIENYNKDCGTKVRVPEIINGLTITKLADTSGDYEATNVFANKNITNLWLPNTITYIGNWSVFNNKLTTIDIPEGVTYIGSHAFYRNNLTGKLDLPNNLKTIGNVAFHWNNITEVNIPSSVTTLGGGTFSYNNITGANVYIYGRKSDGSIDYTKLDSYGGKDASGTSLPSTVTYIDNAAYFHVTLPSFEIPSKVTHIGYYAFASNSELRSLSLSNIKLNEGLTYIGISAFQSTNLTTVDIPSTVTGIEHDAFTDTPNLKTININRKTNAISGSPWGATGVTVNWTGTK